MAKNKMDRWTTPEGLILIEGWARDGLTDEQIAHNMGISTTSFYEYKKKSTDISEALKNGKEVVDFMVENALLKSAMDGNTTAQIFWLKNRKAKQWRDKVEVEADVDNNTTGIIQIPPVLENK